MQLAPVKKINEEKLTITSYSTDPLTLLYLGSKEMYRDKGYSCYRVDELIHQLLFSLKKYTW